MQCSIIPKILNKKTNKLEESRLFSSLLSLFDRQQAVNLYLTTKNEKFNKLEGIEYDDLGEPTIDSLMTNKVFKKLIPDSYILTKLNKDYEGFVENTYENYSNLMDKIINFNSNSQYSKDFILTIDYTDNKVGIKVKKRSIENEQEVESTISNYLLNKKLRKFLENKGVGVGALTELEKRLSISGVTDFSMAQTEADGLIEIIRIAKGIEGEKALPEEFSHFIIEALKGNTIIRRLINNIDSSKAYIEILGDEFEKYDKLYNGNSTQLATESLGKLLTKHLENNSEHKITKLSLFSRAIQYIKDFFSKWNENDIKSIIKDAENEVNKLAKSVLNNTFNHDIKLSNITSSEKYYKVVEEVNRDKALLERIIENEAKRLKIYSKRNPNSNFDENQKEFIDELRKSLKNNIEVQGIYYFVERALEELVKVEKRLHSIRKNEEMSIQEKASILRNARNYIFSYKNIIKDIRGVVSDSRLNEDNTYEESINNKLMIVSSLIDDIFIEYDRLVKPLFLSFIKPIFGDKSLVVPFGKNKGKEITIESLLETSENDISLLSRWLDSMARSSNFFHKIIDRVVKLAKEKARLLTLDYRKRLEEAKIKLEKAGYTNTDFMFEMRDGKKTGRYIFYKDALKLSKPQYEYYMTVMSIKEELDNMLPPDATTLRNIIKIRKDLVERIKGSSGSDIIKELKESAKDSLFVRSDDIELGTKNTLMDFEGREVETLPIYYINIKEGESLDDISTDVTSTLTAYAAMATNYSEMNGIIDVLEIGRTIIREGKTQQTKGGKPLNENTSIFGIDINKTLTKKNTESNILARLDDYFSMQVYGRYLADEGTLGSSKVSVAKATNVINKTTTLNRLALSVLSSIANATIGDVMLKIEAFSSHHFSVKDLWKADNIYKKHSLEYMGEIGKRVKTSKLALWSELFNVMQDYEVEIQNTDFDKMTRFSRLFNSSTLHFMQHAGEHWLQHRSSLALANKYKMLDKQGNKVSLWDAMEVVYIDPNNKELGAKLKVKEGYTKLDGNPLTEEDISEFTLKTHSINNSMHGIYNQLDKNAIQRLAVGRLAMHFRKHIVEGFNKRYRKLDYNFNTQEWEEGRYISMFRFLGQVSKELKEGRFNLVANFKELSDIEKDNIKGALTELSIFTLVGLLLAFIDFPDKKESTWVTAMLEYQARRLYTELGAFTPTPSAISESLKILNSPAAGVNTMEDLLNIFDLANPYNYETFAGKDAIIKSGRYKGKSKATKLVFESPLVPMYKTIYRGIYPEESIPYYKNN